jgi:hypothetical protein
VPYRCCLPERGGGIARSRSVSRGLARPVARALSSATATALSARVSITNSRSRAIARALPIAVTVAISLSVTDANAATKPWSSRPPRTPRHDRWRRCDTRPAGAVDGRRCRPHASAVAGCGGIRQRAVP